MSQEGLGVVAGIDEMSASARMNQYERGKHAPDWLTVEKLAAALDVPVSYFYAADDATAEMLALFHKLPDPLKHELLLTAKAFAALHAARGDDARP